MNRLVTCNWRFGKLIPSVTLFSISSYQLPVTSLSGSWSQGAVKKPWRLPINLVPSGVSRSTSHPRAPSPGEIRAD